MESYVTVRVSDPSDYGDTEFEDDFDDEFKLDALKQTLAEFFACREAT